MRCPIKTNRPKDNKILLLESACVSGKHDRPRFADRDTLGIVG